MMKKYFCGGLFLAVCFFGVTASGAAALSAGAYLAPQLVISARQSSAFFHNAGKLPEADAAALIAQLQSDDWVQARDAAEQIGRHNIMSAEPLLISLLERRQPLGLLAAVVEALAALRSADADNRLCALFSDILHDGEQIRYKELMRGIIDALGQAGTEQAMLFLGGVLRDVTINIHIRECAALNLSFYPDRRAVNILLEELQADLSPVQRAIRTALKQIAAPEDVARIEERTRGISLRSEQNPLLRAAEQEGFEPNGAVGRFAFRQGITEMIVNRHAEPVLVLGDVVVEISRERFTEAYYARLAASRPSFDDYWKNPDIRTRIIPEQMRSAIVREIAVPRPAGDEHPEIEIIRQALDVQGVEYYRHRDGVLMLDDENAGRLGLWSKDGSVLIPTHDRPVPFALPSAMYPVRGETAIFCGRFPVMLVSEGSGAVIVRLQEKFPEIEIKNIPCGFITLRLSDGRDILIQSSHTDCVLEVIPQPLTRHGRPIVLVDPRYYQELMLRPHTRHLVQWLKNVPRAEFVIVPQEEAYLNPANFILLPDNRIVLNKAPQTRQQLLNAGVLPERLIMLLKEVTSLAALRGMIGCTAGIYARERVFGAHQALSGRLRRNHSAVGSVAAMLEQGI
ncbi:MAG: hypothetical protein NC924_02935 [Candidatus Omnitrophica bacterium]|nr:hypothetical protein [Candidatus Omnitrophota bacterium]